VGVIVNSAADPGLSEAVAKGMLDSQFAENGRGWLGVAGGIISAGIAAVDHAFGWASDVVVAMLGLGSDSNRAVASNGSAAAPGIPASHRPDDAMSYTYVPRQVPAGDGR
jgi:hypothetical protein